MDINQITCPEDIMEYLNEHIEYGWNDLNGISHIDMNNFRKLFRTSSIEKTIKSGMGTCIEQVHLTKHFLDKLNIKNKMFCCRIFEPDDYNNLQEEEHMHCFILYYLNNKIYHFEHANCKLKGFYEYNSEDEAVKKIVKYYIDMRGGKESPTTEFYHVEEGLTFKEFNHYINSLTETQPIIDTQKQMVIHQ